MKDLFLVMISVMCMIFCVACAVCAVSTITMHEKITELEKKNEKITALVQQHDEIMLTYQFFNEHWEKWAYK